MATTFDLTQLDFFQGLGEADLRPLMENARIRACQASEVLFHEGGALEPNLRILLSGGLEIRKSAANGKETVVRLIRPNEIFAVAALFDRKVAPGTVVASEKSQILEIRMEDIEATMTENPRIAMKLLVAFAQRLRDTQDALHAVVSERAKTRLAALILRILDREGGTPTSDGLMLKTKLPHGTLSRMVGITYEECVRLIRDWCHEPAILRYERGGTITVVDRDRLERQILDE
jgi:CRP-like cAMP-binding protein